MRKWSKETLVSYFGEYKLVQSLWAIVWRFLQRTAKRITELSLEFVPEFSAPGEQRKEKHRSKASLGCRASSRHPVAHNGTGSQSKLPRDIVIVLLGVLAGEMKPVYQQALLHSLQHCSQQPRCEITQCLSAHEWTGRTKMWHIHTMRGYSSFKNRRKF